MTMFSSYHTFLINTALNKLNHFLNPFFFYSHAFLSPLFLSFQFCCCLANQRAMLYLLCQMYYPFSVFCSQDPYLIVKVESTEFIIFVSIVIHITHKNIIIMLSYIKILQSLQLT